MEASFFKNVDNYDTLYNNSHHFTGIIARYSSIATVFLSDKDFSDFCSDFLNSYDYLMPFIDKAIITKGVWKCVSVVCNNCALLVIMEHYQYPRYMAIASK